MTPTRGFPEVQSGWVQNLPGLWTSRVSALSLGLNLDASHLDVLFWTFYLDVLILTPGYFSTRVPDAFDSDIFHFQLDYLCKYSFQKFRTVF